MAVPLVCLWNASPLNEKRGETKMRSALIAALLAGVVALSQNITAGQGRTRFAVSGGLAAPMGDLGDVADLGYNVTAGLSSEAHASRLGRESTGA